jgi:hypothetical protein
LDGVEGCGWACTLWNVGKNFLLEPVVDSISKLFTNKYPDGFDPNYWNDLVNEPFDINITPGAENLENILKGDPQEFDPNNLNIGTYEPQNDIFENLETFPGNHSADDFLNGDTYTFPDGDKFLDLDSDIPGFDGDIGDLLPLFLPTDVPNKPIGKPTRLTEKWLEQEGIDAHDLKDGQVPGKLSEFDIYKDKEGNLWGVRKGQNPKTSDIYLGNLESYGL